MAKPTQEEENQANYMGSGKPTYEDTTAEQASDKKGASYNPDQSQPDYIYTRRWQEYR